MATGKIQSYQRDKGFAFIRPDQGGDDVFVHRSAVAGQFDAMGEGQAVQYELDPKSDRPRAKRVVPKGKPPAVAPGSKRSLRPASRPPLSRKRPATGGRPSNGPRQNTAKRPTWAPPDEQCIQGFVTKLFRWEDPPFGFISPDAKGRELRFEPKAVPGREGFQKLQVGDYVQCAIRPETAETREPVAYYVNPIPRPAILPSLQLSRHPKARKRKPSWR